MKGNKRWIEIESLLLSSQVKETAMLVVKDVSHIYKYNKEKALANLKTTLFACIAHDFRTPVNAIMSTNQLFQANLPTGYERMLKI